MRPSTRLQSAALGAAFLTLGPLATQALAAGPSAAGAAPSWAPTATRAAQVGRATASGPTAGSRPLNLVITLKPANQSAEAAALRAMYTPGSATYHHFLTPGQWVARYGPGTANTSSLRNYLAAHHFTSIALLPNRLVMTARATAAQAESAFHTRLADFRVGPIRFYANTSAAMVPRALSGTVEAVLGLNDLPLPAMHPLSRRNTARRQGTSASGGPELAGLDPAQFQVTYDAKGTPSGWGTSVALFTEGDMTGVIKDLRLAEAKNHLAQVPVTQINVGPQSGDTAGADEFDMDTQVSSAMATTVKRLYLYNTGSLVDSQVDLDIATFVAQDRAEAMSASIGGCDVSAFADGSMISTDQALQEGAMQGQTLFASSGDNGDGCAFVAATGAPSSFPGTNWPASGEFTTAVGGTSLVVDHTGSRISEVGWLGSGGGLSETENSGWWTNDTDKGAANSMRSVPDIALDADPNVATPAKVYVNGQVSYIGGTSLSSPLMLGAWARLETAHANRLGLAAIDLYAVYDKVNPGLGTVGGVVSVGVPSPLPAPVPGLTDITLGNNGGYSCAPGYDEVTGLGAPDIALLNRALR